MNEKEFFANIFDRNRVHLIEKQYFYHKVQSLQFKKMDPIMATAKNVYDCNKSSLCQ